MVSATIKKLRPRVESALAASPVFDLRDLQVAHHQDSLVLSGTVSSFYHKQLAQELVRNVAGEVVVVNEVQVA